MAIETFVLATASGPTMAAEAEPDEIDFEPAPVRGGVVVVHEEYGLTERTSQICQRFADAGWHAVAPDLFHRIGSPVFGHADEEGPSAAAATLRGTDLLDDLDAAMKWLADVGIAINRCAVVGYGLGGAVALLAAAHLPVAAAVSVCGDGITESRFGEHPQLLLAPRLLAPWLGLYGGNDPATPAVEVDALRVAAATARVPTEVVSYPGAGHRFHDEQAPPELDGYDEHAARDAWARTLAWLRAHVPA